MTGDCRSEEGITIGLIDSLITIARILADRDLTPAGVKEALADFRADEDIAYLLGEKLLPTVEQIQKLRDQGYMVVKVPACNKDYDHGRHDLVTKTKSCPGKGKIPHGIQSWHMGTFGEWANCKCGYSFSHYMGDPFTEWEKHKKEHGIDEQSTN